MNRGLRSAGVVMIVLVGLALASCATPQEPVEYQPATRLPPLSPVPTAALVPAVPGRVTSAPVPTAGPSAQAPTPPSPDGIATAAVTIGMITPVPILENTPAPGAVLTVVLPGGTPGGFGPFLTATPISGSGITPAANGTATGSEAVTLVTSTPGATQTPPPANTPSGTQSPSGTATSAGTQGAGGTATPAGNATPTGTATPGETGTPSGAGTPNGSPEPSGSPTAAQQAGAAAGGSGGAVSSASETAQPFATIPATMLNSPSAGHPLGQTPEEQQLLDLGGQVYGTNCATCHGNGGEGTASFPALDGNVTVNGDAQLVIQTVLSGKGLMPPFRNKLSDQEIAAVVSYIRSAWTNSAPPVSVDMVNNRDR